MQNRVKKNKINKKLEITQKLEKSLAFFRHPQCRVRKVLPTFSAGRHGHNYTAGFQEDFLYDTMGTS